MRQRVRYANYDLGEQLEGSTAIVRLYGSSANVMLLDAANFQRYRIGQRFAYAGGYQRRSPVELRIPNDGHWYVVLDLGGYGGRVQGAVSVVSPEGAPQEAEDEGTLVEAGVR